MTERIPPPMVPPHPLLSPSRARAEAHLGGKWAHREALIESRKMQLFYAAITSRAGLTLPCPWCKSRREKLGSLLEPTEDDLRWEVPGRDVSRRWDGAVPEESFGVY